MSTIAVLLPTLHNRVEIPESMRPEEKERLIGDLGKISTEIASSTARAEERQKAQVQRFRSAEARLAKLEQGANASSQHDIEVLQKALDAERVNMGRWKWWALSIAATLGTSAIVGLVVFYATNH